MQKRVLSLVLVLCMLLTMVPALALSVFAEDVTATVTFVDADNNVVSEQTVTGATLDFTVPEVPADAFGWYNITPAGSIREASTFVGAAAADVTFYLLETTSTFGYNSNWPLYTPKTSLDGWRGGWTAGSYIDNIYTLFDNVESNNILQNKGIWSYAGIYLSGRCVTQKTGMLALSYNVPASGVIDIDVDALTIAVNTDGCVFSDMAMAIAVNGVIVWPASAAGQKVQNNPVSGTSYQFLYYNQGMNTHTTYTGDISTDWAYLAMLGQEVPESYTDLSDMTVDALGFDYTKYMGAGTSWDTKLANAKTALEEAQAGGDEAAIATAQAAVDAAQLDVDRWNIVKGLCRPVTEVAKTGSLLSAYEAYCDENGYPHDLAVNAGDRVDVVFSRVNNPHISPRLTVSYDKVTSVAVTEDTFFDYEFVGSQLLAGATNWPTAEKRADSGYNLLQDFADGWSMIGYDAGTINKQKFAGTYYEFGGWPEGILWLDDYGLSRSAVNGVVKNFQEYGAGFAYLAPMNGTVTIDAVFGTPIATASRTVYFAIYKINAEGTTLVYPAAGATGANIADAATEGAGIKYNAAGMKSESATGVEVAVGDQLVFVWRDSNIMSNTSWSNGDFANNFDLKVAYTDYVPSSTFAPTNGQNKPQHGTTAGDKATFSGGWDLVSHAGLTDWTAGEQINTVIETFTGRDGWLSPGWTGSIWGGIWGKGFTLAYQGCAEHPGWPNGYGVIPTQTSTGGWRYTPEYDGTVDLSITYLLSRHQIGNNGYVAVFLNGEMVWPMAEGADTNYYGDINKWAVIGSYKTELNAAAVAALAVKDGSEKTGSLTGITVEVGDALEILVRNDEAATTFWNDNSCGFECRATVAYTEADLTSAVVEPMSTSRLDQSYPTNVPTNEQQNGEVKPIFADPAWSFVNYAKRIISAENANTDFFATNRGESSWGDSFWSSTEFATDNWGDGRNTIYRLYGSDHWGAQFSVSPSHWTYGGYRYTAPAAGKINIDVTKLTTYATGETKTVGEGEEATQVLLKNGALAVAIYIDQVKVWPAADEWFVLAEEGVDYTAAAVASIGETLDNLYVGQGSTIDFLVKHTNMDDKLSQWNIRGTVFEGAVSYIEQYPVSATGAVSVGDAFTFTADAVAGAAENIQAAVVDVAAKDVCNKFAYTVTGEIDGKAVILATGVTSMKDALMAYVTADAADKVSNMAIASLNYAAAAQKYFAPETEDAALANAGLSEGQKVVAPAGSYTEAARVATVEGAQAQLVGISLLLEEKIALKLVFDTDVEGAKVQMADNADFTGATEVAYTATNDGNAFKAITEGIGAANYNSLIYIRVVDAEGVVISNTIAYSVAAYCGNMKGTVGAVADAILALYDAAAAYNA